MSVVTNAGGAAAALNNQQTRAEVPAQPRRDDDGFPVVGFGLLAAFIAAMLLLIWYGGRPGPRKRNSP